MGSGSDATPSSSSSFVKVNISSSSHLGVGNLVGEQGARRVSTEEHELYWISSARAR